MAKILHTADLHIKDGEEKAYCFGVLDEIIALAIYQKAGFLVIAGDLFDSFSDFEALRGEVGVRLKPLMEAGCKIIYIPGNHEGRGSPAPLSKFNLDPIKFYAKLPFTFVEMDGIEFLCVPHTGNYDGYREWKIPAKKPGVARIAVLHALNSTIYTGPDPETDSRAGVIDDDFFKRFSIDYAALGHVHAGREQSLGGVVACYPGSPRVWRAHIREAGVKSVRMVEITGAAVNTWAENLDSAGRYLEYRLPLDLNGTLSEDAIKKLEKDISELDLVSVRLSGVIENENDAKAAAAVLEARLRKRARQAYVLLETDLAGEISENSVTKNFLAELDKLKPLEAQRDEYLKWLLARRLGLEALAGHIRGAK